MVELMKQAFEALEALPKDDRDRIASEIIERVGDKAEWDRIVAEPTSQDWLASRAKTALKKHAKSHKKVSMTFISLPDNLMRDDGYWSNFDDLPADIRQLAEKNYKLWKDNPKNPGLRFKQIHSDQPIFSFRVGMKHRTVGTETTDGKIAWFWIGSFETFKDTVAAAAA